jgi:hypothetical protein
MASYLRKACLQLRIKPSAGRPRLTSNIDDDREGFAVRSAQHLKELPVGVGRVDPPAA